MSRVAHPHARSGPDRALTALAVALGLAAAASAGTPKAPAAPALPPLNQKVIEFARERTGQKVSNGECTNLAVEALRYAGARRFPFDPGGDFVWGRPVDSFKDALPGDILQFRDTVFDGKKYVTRRRWITWHQEYPHHTAIVDEVRDRGREVTVLHQNVGPHDADEAAKRVVQRDVIRPDSQKEGRVWIYRPVGRDEPAPDAAGDRDPG
jgi:hypothetical protein